MNRTQYLAAVVITGLCWLTLVYWRGVARVYPPTMAAIPLPPEPTHDTGVKTLASWYDSGRCKDGSRFTGRARTCASWVWPRGTRLVAIRTMPDGSERRTWAVVNDYGPSQLVPHQVGRMVDFSRKCAEDLDMVSAGVARVTVYTFDARGQI